jgi:hypothetical protein
MGLPSVVLELVPLKNEEAMNRKLLLEVKVMHCRYLILNAPYDGVELFDALFLLDLRETHEQLSIAQLCHCGSLGLNFLAHVSLPLELLSFAAVFEL